MPTRGHSVSDGTHREEVEVVTEKQEQVHAEEERKKAVASRTREKKVVHKRKKKEARRQAKRAEQKILWEAQQRRIQQRPRQFDIQLEGGGLEITTMIDADTFSVAEYHAQMAQDSDGNVSWTDLYEDSSHASDSNWS